MNAKQILTILVVIVLVFLTGIALGYAMNNVDTDASAEVSVVSNEKSDSAHIIYEMHYKFIPFFKVVYRCDVPVVRHVPHYKLNVIRTNVLVGVGQEDNSNTDIVTNTATPTPVITIIVTPTPIITTVPAPTSTPMPDTNHCNNGLGNGSDCPPPGHDKNDDGVADTDKGDNDDDNQSRPCGDKGDPCNKSGKNGFVLPIASLIMKLRIRRQIAKANRIVYVKKDIGNPLLDSLMQHTLPDESYCINDCRHCLDNCVEDKQLLMWQCNNQ